MTIRLTFLTGINGSGKTTVLNSLIALLLPDLQALSSLEHERIEVVLDESGRQVFIKSEADEESVVLSTSGAADALRIRRYVIDRDASPAKQREGEQEYFRELLSENAAHPVLRALNALPTPMFLGLDRRPRHDAQERRIRGGFYYRSPTPFRAHSTSSLALGVDDAALLAFTRYRSALIDAGKITQELKREMILSLVAVSPQGFGDISVPTNSELNQIKVIRRDLSTLSDILGLDETDVQARVVPFLNELEQAAKRIPKGRPATELVESGSDYISPLFSWSANKSQLNRIRALSDLVKRYNDSRSEIMEPVVAYTRLVDAFLSASGKQIVLDSDGPVAVRIPNADKPKDISSLSSGEAQIFVILTQLAFASETRAGNVFIIDEPELSLHIDWQDIFVDSILDANPNVQYILATHAPGIILDKTDFCVDLSGRRL